MTVAAVLLAAGASTRFGSHDKLAASLGGLALGAHTARTLRPLPLAMHFVVTGHSTLARDGFERVPNDQPEEGMGRSIARGVGAAHRAGAKAVLIALADMPLVSSRYFERVLRSYDGPSTLVAPSDGIQRMPPALFGTDWYETLENLSEDRGARELLGQAKLVQAATGELIDVDGPDNLRTAAASSAVPTKETKPG